MKVVPPPPPWPRSWAGSVHRSARLPRRLRRRRLVRPTAPAAIRHASTLRITDSPVTSAERVVVQFTGLEIKPVGAADARGLRLRAAADRPARARRRRQRNPARGELLPAGEYESIRLKVNAGRNASDSFIELEDGSVHPLFIPSGNQTGLKLIRGFIIGAGSTHNFTIDFDLRKSVVHPPGLGDPYLLKPVLRLVNNLEVGTIDGTVAPGLVVDGCVPAVYLYTGAGIVPDDLGSAAPPLASTAVNLDNATGAWRFRLAFVPAGANTLAFTCAADDDGAEVDDAIVFSAPINVTVWPDKQTRWTSLRRDAPRGAANRVDPPRPGCDILSRR